MLLRILFTLVIGGFHFSLKMPIAFSQDGPMRTYQTEAGYRPAAPASFSHEAPSSNSRQITPQQLEYMQNQPTQQIHLAAGSRSSQGRPKKENAQHGIELSNASEALNPVKRTPFSPPTKAGQELEKEPDSALGSFVSVASSLFLVIGLFLGLVWILNRNQAKGKAALPEEVLQVLGRTAVGPKQQLVVLRFGPKILLVSQFQGEMRPLGELQDASAVDDVLTACNLEVGSSSNSKSRESDSVLGAGLEQAKLLADSLFQSGNSLAATKDHASAKNTNAASNGSANSSGVLEQGV
ncbi:MAG: flagellar biosynthetic protein FliO [Planctomycetota bacterium]